MLFSNFKTLVMKEKGEVIFYEMGSDDARIEVLLSDDTVWLTQNQLVELFRSSKSNISEHIKHIFSSRELESEATVRKFRTVQQEGKRMIDRDLEHCHLKLLIINT